MHVESARCFHLYIIIYGQMSDIYIYIKLHSAVQTKQKCPDECPDVFAKFGRVFVLGVAE